MTQSTDITYKSKLIQNVLQYNIVQVPKGIVLWKDRIRNDSDYVPTNRSTLFIRAWVNM